MGIVGWADAPNSISEEQLGDEETVIVEESEQVAEENDSTGNQVEVKSEPITTPMKAKSIETRALESVKTPLETSAGEELLEAIRSLKLKSGKDECDISKFELHEVKFLFNHAERQGFSDYYGVVKEVFAVKHRILDKVDDIDDTESPNLDELLAFAESKYEQSFENGNA